jgi:hemoglobin-like flavoprotein
MAGEHIMTPEQVTLVQRSFAKLAPTAAEAAIMFYDRLFQLSPPIKLMFPAEMTGQRQKLMVTLSVVVNGLSNLQSVLPAASALARRHVDYGVKPEHYPVVGSALLFTLEKGLGDAWTAEVAQAWTAAYSTLSTFMIEQAYGQPPAG